MKAAETEQESGLGRLGVTFEEIIGKMENMLKEHGSSLNSDTDLEEVIQTARDAVEATPEDHPNRAGWLNNLGNSLGDRYKRTGAMADLEEAIQTAR
ncbi:CHAT domain-containing protein [Apiospora phragmitis]|uniref:CHAT domain-containing protein n=1 Tax=Apiospora phragmitis TaxID=2905665 RepID=A0ABR1UHM3_9PEZI